MDVAHLLDRAKRPTRLTFVRHACGRRFVSREKDGGFSAAAREAPGRTAFGLRKRGKWGKAGCRYEQLLCAGSAGRADQRSSSLSPQKLTKCYRQIEVGAAWVVVFVIVPARCADISQQLRRATRRVGGKELCYSTCCKIFTIRRVITVLQCSVWVSSSRDRITEMSKQNYLFCRTRDANLSRSTVSFSRQRNPWTTTIFLGEMYHLAS